MITQETLNNLTNEIWKSAERLRGKFKAYEYQSVILPIIVIRRIECVLIEMREATRSEIQSKRPDIAAKNLEEMVKKMELSTYHFFNSTNWSLDAIYQEDHTIMEKNFRDYINGFSENIQEIIDHFNYRAVIGQMKKNGRLAPIINQYRNQDLNPNRISNIEMGYIYEELLRRFSEQSGEEAGEHFTPREVIRLMVELLDIAVKDKHVSIYDPACGTGGMLSVAKAHVLDRVKDENQKSKMETLITLHGHEIQPQNYAICKADMLIKNDANAYIYYGNSLVPHDPESDDPGDQLAGNSDKFDYMLSNPPFGVTWGGEDGYEKEARKLEKSRYKAGMPRTNDGALLFLQTIISKMKQVNEGGSKVAIIFNGSPLSNGDCGSGESEIRRWILENDLLDAIVMLPDQLFYNTGIFTYIWLLSNKKLSEHKENVMIIDARNQFEKEPKSFGHKRNRITDEHRSWIEKQYKQGWKNGYENENVKIFSNKDFAFHKVAVTFWQTDEKDQPMMVTEGFDVQLSNSNVKKKFDLYGDLDFLVSLVSPEDEKKEYALKINADSKSFEVQLTALALTDFPVLKKEKTTAKIFKALKTWELSAKYTHKHYIQDDEYIPNGEDIEAFLEREIAKPIIKWEDRPQLGYEILPNKYFYKYEPPKPADEILNEFWKLEKEAEEILKGLK
ncbi:MAG: restriction endonuclease subunit M [Spirochaetaceae bacterium 4572_59]|nr:MAG: restriction endonuclease subunit M [Spirochaetaceae bacterium 4572_59]